MTVQGFNQDYYLGVKLAQLQSTSPEWVGKTTTDLQNYLAKAGLTPAMHYEIYGYKEGLAPNSSFNEAEYKQAKATQMFNAGQAASIDAALADFNAKWPGNAYEHYVQYGFKENVNASNSFDESLYLDSKLAALKADPATSAAWATKTVADLKTAFGAMTALSHYEWYGKAEGLKPIAVPAGEAVVVPTPASGFTLTNGTDVATANVFTSGLVYTPGGNDRINALQDEDILTGSGANPTLNATLGNANDNGATIITPTLNGIETLNVAFTGSGAAVTDLDLQDATGQKEINITRVSQAIDRAEIGNIMSPVAKMTLADTNANAKGAIEFSFAQGVLKGANAASIEVKNVNIGTFNLGENTSGIGAIGVGLNGYETLTINSTASNNTIGTLNIPMDTGTDGKVVLTGDKSLTLATTTPILTAATSTNVEAVTHGGGIAMANGRLATIDASAMTAPLVLNISKGLLSDGKAETSGVVQDVTVIGTKGDDTFYLNDLVEAGDKIQGGDGNDTLVAYQGGILGMVTKVEKVDVQMRNADVAIDFDMVPDAVVQNIRNISSKDVAATVDPLTGRVITPAYTVAADDFGDQTAKLVDLTAVQAAGLNIQHSTTHNNAITDTTVDVSLKTVTGANDTVKIAIQEGINIDPRFNFTLKTNAIYSNGVENITIEDKDSESNSVELTSFVNHTGTVTLSGGKAGTFLNLDVDTAALPAALQGLQMRDVTGGNVDSVSMSNDGLTAKADGSTGLTDVANLATEVRIVAGKIDAGSEASDVTVRVSTTKANTDGGQEIIMGSGNDVVIFDDISPDSATRGSAGLTNADKVSGGAGNNILAIDGHGVNVIVQQSEWDNVSNFQTIYLAGNGAGNQYYLQIDNDMITKNGVGGNMITVLNDDMSSVDPYTGVGTDSRVTNTALRLDATTLSADKHFTYDGEEGSGSTVDRFVVNDQNTNGGNIIDGGDVNIFLGVDANGIYRQLEGVQSSDVIEVRNTATVTTADLAFVKNVGHIVINNDQAVKQTLNLTLNSTVLDAMSDSGHTATAKEIEKFNITANDLQMKDAAGSIINPNAASILNVNARDVSGFYSLNVKGDSIFAGDDIINMAVNLGGASSTFALSGGNDTINFYGLIEGNIVTNVAGKYTFTDSTGVAKQEFNTSDVEVVRYFTTDAKELFNDGTGKLTLTGGGVTPPPSGDFTNVNLGTTNVTASATVKEAFVYDFQMVNGRATTSATDGNVTITGFDVAADKLVFQDTGSGQVYTEAQFKALAGVTISENPINITTSFFFDPNPTSGLIGSVMLTGVVDKALTNIVVETLA